MATRQNNRPQTTEAEEQSPLQSLVPILEDLRWRILKSLVAIVAGAVIAFFFRAQIVTLLALPFSQYIKEPILTNQSLVVTGITEGFLVVLKLSLAVGFIFALPLILYQIWAFIVSTWLKQAKQKRSAFVFVGIGMLLFAAGIYLGYMLLRYPLAFFVDFATESFTSLITAQSYFGFVTMFLLTFGLAFEIPLVLMLLAQIGVVTPETLKRKRRVAHFSLWVAATFLMPGSDIWSPVIMGLTLSGLYEFSIVLIHWIGRENSSLPGSVAKNLKLRK